MTIAGVQLIVGGIGLGCIVWGLSQVQAAGERRNKEIDVLGKALERQPDIVLFLNGLPVVVVECKSPRVKDAIPEAIDQMLRYSEQRGVTGEGSAPLFYFNQFVVATCRQEAKFGTITAQSEKYFYRWTRPLSENGQRPRSWHGQPKRPAAPGRRDDGLGQPA